MGFRDLADVAPAAFLRAAWQILHLLIPRAAGASVVRGPGYYKPFEQMLGAGSFDDSFPGSRNGFLMANPGRMDPVKMAYFSVSGSPTATVVYSIHLGPDLVSSFRGWNGTSLPTSTRDSRV